MGYVTLVVWFLTKHFKVHSFGRESICKTAIALTSRIWQHVIHCHVHTHSTVYANQVAEFKHFRMEYEKLLPKQRKAVETFVCLLAGYRKSFVMATFHRIQPFELFTTLCSWSSASLPHAKHRTDTAP